MTTFKQGLAFLESSRAHYWWLILILLINLAFRLSLLVNDSVYMDEGQTLYQINKPVDRIIDGYAKSQQNAPLYFILMHYWVKVFGLSIFNVRLFSALCMALAAVLFFVMARKGLKLFYALGASALFLLHHPFQEFAHEARGYAFVLLLALVSIWFFLKLLEKPSWKWSVAIGVVNLAMLYTHYLTVYLILVQGATLLLLFKKHPKALKQWILVHVGVAAGFAPWLPVLFGVMPEMGNYWIPKPTWPLLRNLYLDISPRYKSFWPASIILLGGLLWYFWQRKRTSTFPGSSIVLMVLWGLGIYHIHYLVGHVKPVFIYKYVLYATPGYLLLFSWSIAQWPGRKWLHPLLFAACITGFASKFTFETPKRENWHPIVQYMDKHHHDNSIVFLQTSYSYKPLVAEWNIDWFTTPEHIYDSLDHHNIHGCDDVKRAHKLLESHKADTILFIRCHSGAIDKEGKVKHTLDQELREIDYIESRDVRLNVYVREATKL